MSINYHGLVNIYKGRWYNSYQNILSRYLYIFMQSNIVLVRVWSLDNSSSRDTSELQMICAKGEITFVLTGKNIQQANNTQKQHV